MQRKRDWAAFSVAHNWRIRRRLPRITLYAIERGLIPMKMSLEPTAYQLFQILFSNGEYGKQRFGQAFYNHFELHKLADQNALENLYELDGQAAKDKIHKIFDVIT